MHTKLFHKKILAAVLLSFLFFFSKGQGPLEQLRAKQAIILNSLRYTDGNQGFNKILSSDANGNAFWRDPLKDSFAIEDFFYVKHTTGIPDSLKLKKELPRKFWATPSTGTDSGRASYRPITLADLPAGIGGGAAAGLDSQYVSADSLYQIYVYASGRRDTVQYSGAGGSADLWSLQGSNVYRPYGFVGINISNPTARLTLKSNIEWNATVNDSSGLTLRNDNDTTHLRSYSSPPVTFKMNSYNSYRARVFPSSIRIRGVGDNFLQYRTPSLVIEGMNDSTNTYQTMATIGPNGSYVIQSTSILPGIIITDNVSTTNVSAANSIVTARQNINSTSYDTANSCALQLNGNTRGFILPRLSSAQRSQIERVITSITVNTGGSSYSVPPLVTAFGGTPFNFPVLSSTISGGVVTAINVTYGGRYYGTPPIVITPPVGETGSGATATATTVQDIKPGTKIFCTDCLANNGVTGVEQVWAGGQWNNTY